ncbi:Mu-like prophage tail sheath protein gpL [Pseudoxanthobacter soli DSM 19599]|uniref:Mu-like prophage tail sheath protein gpL n=1 Tax=Pseudoxanthobacter soli DSM 19599 TaxID=1123029 RepID=A0A1M7ZLQ5_9HYPH|nr:phage tail sheath subtilisin-like domain-containing protein [Pseudoxanthobacter soli]SHO65817.1 Mu-like prophage tail sheath protein gpL [Pseudoxanthobacter soli DSM 19599]
MAGIGFNNIPGSGVIAPLMSFEFNSAGQYDSVSRLYLVGHKAAAGTLAANTPTICTSLAEATMLAGAGSMLREMWRIVALNAPAQETWLVAVTETGAAPTWTYTLASVPAAGGTGYVEICGERVIVTAAAGDTVTIVAAALAAAINAYSNALTGAMLPVTATAAAGVVTLTARHAGAIMAEIDHSIPTGIAGNIFVGALTVASVTPASGVPSLATALAAIGDDPCGAMVAPWADTASLDAYQAWLSDVAGRWAWSRQSYGHAWCCNSGNTSAQTTLGLGRNDRHTSIIARPATHQRPSWLWAAGFAGRLLPWLSDTTTGNVSRNQTGLVVEGIEAPRDRTAVWGYSARNTLLGAGISTWTATADGRVAVDKIVTTYRTGPTGQPDSVFRDVQSVYQLAGGFGYMRERLASEQGNKALMDSNPGALEAVTTPADIKATLIHGYEALEQRGVFEDAATFAASVIVRRNAANPARVDMFLPMDRVNPLDILAGNATIYAQYI